jgi:hypothetical protein
MAYTQNFGMIYSIDWSNNHRCTRRSVNCCNNSSPSGHAGPPSLRTHRIFERSIDLFFHWSILHPIIDRSLKSSGKKKIENFWEGSLTSTVGRLVVMLRQSRVRSSAWLNLLVNQAQCNMNN